MSHIITKTPTTRSTLARLALIIAVPLLIAHLVVAPRVERWLDSKLPTQLAIISELQSQIPNKTAGFNDVTMHSGDNQRVLTFSLTGKQHLTEQEAQTAYTVICSRLGDTVKNYDSIHLQSVAEKRFLVVFYSRDNRLMSFHCTPDEQTTQADTPVPDSDLAPLPPPAQLPVPKDGDFQLEGEDSVKDANITCCYLQ